MEIYINGEARQVTPGISVAQLLASLNCVGRRVAVEVNHDIVPRSVHETRVVNPGDKVEIVHAIGGG
jgi:sulfur carrier protein